MLDYLPLEIVLLSLMATYESWGRFPKVSQQIYPLGWRTDTLPSHENTSLLPYGMGRSYGDVCLNANGTLLATRQLNRFISFDPEQGILCCEAGVSFDEILSFAVPRGWFLPTTPGTRFITVGGAIGNDVHGKNHHRAGTFGKHVRRFELVRSNGERLICSPTENTELYKATIGGLGLTGLITWAEFGLKPILHRAMSSETIRFGDLEEFFELSRQSDKEYEYTMSWVDCSSQGKHLGRGIFFRGNHVTQDEVPSHWKAPSKRLTMPMDLPSFALNKLSVRAFNILYYNQQQRKSIKGLTDYEPFFYPLDAVLEWNRLYGKKGFLQYQCVVPYQDHVAIREILQEIAAMGSSSFLAVLKTFGEVESPGMLSFPRKGVTLALDFPIKGAGTFELLDRLDARVRDAGGAVYPCKDARLSPQNFQAYYPQWQAFAAHIDPAFSSSFWRRVTREIYA